MEVVTENELAWAAGLYDGEGSASTYVPRRRKTARRQMQVSQAGVAGSPPEVLVRFQAIVGEGNVTGPYRGYLFYWKTTRKDAIDEIALALWPYLSAEKRSQFESMTLAAGRSLPRWPSVVRAPAVECSGFRAPSCGSAPSSALASSTARTLHAIPGRGCRNTAFRLGLGKRWRACFESCAPWLSDVKRDDIRRCAARLDTPLPLSTL